MKTKLGNLLRTLHPDIEYRVFLQLHGLEMMPSREISGVDEIKKYLDYEVAFIERDFTITIQSSRLF